MSGRTRLALGLFVVGTLLVPGPAASGQPTPGGEANPGIEIVGGQPADPGEYPFQVALLLHGIGNRRQAQFCGGSLISPDTVLTAAHCVDGARAAQVDVLVGTHTLAPGGGGARLRARRIRVHPAFNPDTLGNDVAVIQLGGSRPEEPVRTIQPGQDGLWSPGTMATVTGWGNRDPDGSDFPLVLHEVEVPILTNAQCAARYPNAYRAPRMLCAGDLVDGGEDSCHGDSGGPLFVADGDDSVQVGITSWGIGCAQRRFPGVYTRLAAVAGFVNPYLDPDSEPDAVTRLRSRRVAARSFRMTWRPPVFDGGTRIIRFRVAIPALGRVHAVPGGQTSFRLRNLPRGRHRVEVRAVNAVGVGAERAKHIHV